MTHRGVFLADLTWVEAQAALNAGAVVVLPLGAAAKEHGPHLPLNTDFLQVEYLARRIVERAAVVVAPTLAYHYYPAFSEYPGSTSLNLETARDLILDICRSLACHGPHRFYVLNVGISTLDPLSQAAAALVGEGILLRYTDPRAIEAPLAEGLVHQPRGTHADEVETSKLLYIAPDRVNMEQALRDCEPENGAGGLTRRPGGPGVYSRSGIWGDATLATRDKGRIFIEALVEGILVEISSLLEAGPSRLRE